MFTLYYHEGAQKDRDVALKRALRSRKFTLSARLHRFYPQTPKSLSKAFEAFEHFTKPGQSLVFFDIKDLKEQLGADFKFSVKFSAITARRPERRIMGFQAIVIVEAVRGKDATDENILPLLNAIAAAADRQAHDRSFGTWIEITDDVPRMKNPARPPRRHPLSPPAKGNNS